MWLETRAPDRTPRSVLERLSGILILYVHLPLADGRELAMPRYAQPERKRGDIGRPTWLNRKSALGVSVPG